MTRACSVNLLPESCHNARQRAVRRNRWTVTVLSAALLVVGAWIALGATHQAILGLHRQLVTEQARHAELDRRLLLATRNRDSLVQRANALVGLRQQQCDRPFLPEQLVSLAQLAPEGVVFEEISGAPVTHPNEGPARPTHPPGANPDAPTPQSPGPVLAVQIKPEALVVRLSGFALDHQQLARLIEALRHVPQWDDVELLRAAREPYLQSEALAFRLECRRSTDSAEKPAPLAEGVP